MEGREDAVARVGCGNEEVGEGGRTRQTRCNRAPFRLNHPGDNIRAANGTSQKWMRPGMPPDSGGILRGCPLLGGAICPNVVSRVDRGAQRPAVLATIPKSALSQ